MNKYKFIEDNMRRATNKIKESCDRANEYDISRQLAASIRAMLDIMYDEIYPEVNLKVLRSDDAKRFPLIKASKKGDVGFDIYAVFPYQEKYSTEASRQEYRDKFPSMSDRQCDIQMREHITIWPGERGVIPTGIKLEIPYGYWASIEARSSTSKRMLVVPKGVIDEGYRGELFAVLLNTGHERVRICDGDRYVQLIMHDRVSRNVIITDVDAISDSERGDSGFGSTGQNTKD